jgi:carboxylate-amine ligase
MLLEHVQDALAHAGDSDTTAELLTAVLRRGTGATFQRNTYRRRGDLPSIVASAITASAAQDR